MQQSSSNQNVQTTPAPVNNPTFDFDDKSPGGINDALMGISFQVKLLMLFTYNAWKNKYNKFCLETEIKMAEKFDDLCFKYDNGLGEKLRLVQAKHKKVPQEMTLPTLIFDKNFSVLKYFASSQRLKKFNEIQHLILCTNNFFKFGNSTAPFFLHDNGRKIYLEEVPGNDEILNLGKRYRFVSSQFNQEWEATKETLYYYFVAQELADHILLKKKPTCHFLETFEYELTSFIVDTIEEKFNELFLDNNLPHLSQFREILGQVIENILKEDPDALSKDLKNRLKKNLWENLKKVPVKFHPNFFQNQSSAKQDLELFMEKFIFVVELYQNNIDNEIMNEFAKELSSNDLQIAYKLFEAYICDWVKKGAKGEYLTEIIVSEFFIDLKSKIKAQQVIGTKMMLLERINETKLEFEFNDKELSEFLYSSKEDKLERIYYVFVADGETFFGSIRVNNCLMSNNQLNTDDSCVSIKSSLPQQQLKIAVDVFALKSCFDLCILECDNGLGPYTELEEIVIQNTSKKLIVIGYKSNFPASVPHSIEFQQESILSEISDRSLEVIFTEKSVTFQKKDIKFIDIVKPSEKDILKNIKLADFLQMQDIASTISVSKTIDKNVFIDRKLYHQVYVKYNALKDRTLCLAFNETEYADKICNPAFTSVHLLGAKNPITGQILSQFDPSTDELYWKRSSGDIKDLRKYFDWTKGNEILPEYFTDPQIQERIVIISECGGMGKTVFLNNLSNILKNTFPEKWIIKLNLNEFTDSFDQNRNIFQRIDHQVAIQFLAEEILRLENLVDRQLFVKNIQENKKVQLILDSYDEVCPDYTVFVINWVKSLLKTSVERIFIATRNELSEILQNELSVVCHKLLPFNNTDQENYLVKYYENLTKIPEKDLKDITREIIRKTMPRIGYIKIIHRRSSVNLSQSYNKQFAGIPLISMLLAESFKNELQSLSKQAYELQAEDAKTALSNFINSLKENSLSPFELYQKFIKQRYQIFLKDKAGLNVSNVYVKQFMKSQFELLDKSHQKVSMLKLFNKELLDDLKPKLNFEINDLELLSLSKCGIVEVTKKSEIGLTIFEYNYIHYTFAELYASKLSIENFNDETFFELILKIVFLEPKYQTLRSFIDYQLPSIVKPRLEWGSIGIRDGFDAVEMPANECVEDDDWERIEMSSAESVSMHVRVLRKVLHGDSSFARILHNAAKEGNLNIFRYLYECLTSNSDGIQHEEFAKSILLYQDTNNNLVFNYYFRFCDDNLNILEQLKSDFGIQFVKTIFKHNKHQTTNNQTKSTFYIERPSNVFETVFESSFYHRKNCVNILEWVQLNFKDELDFGEIFKALDESNNSILHNIVKVEEKSKISRTIKNFFEKSVVKFGLQFLKSLFKLVNTCGHTFLYYIVLNTKEEKPDDLLIDILEWIKEKFGINFVKKLLRKKGEKDENLLHFYAEKCNKNMLENLLKVFFLWIKNNLGSKYFEKFLLQTNNEGKTFFYYIVFNDDQNNSSTIILNTLEWLKMTDKNYMKYNKKLIFSKDIKHVTLLHYYALNCEKIQFFPLFTEILQYVDENFGSKAVEKLLLKKTINQHSILLNIIFNFNLANDAETLIIILLEWLKISIKDSLSFIKNLLVEKDQDGFTVFHCFAKAYSREKFCSATTEVLEWVANNLGRSAVIEILLLKDNDGQTAFNLSALSTSHFSSVKELTPFLDFVKFYTDEETVKKLILSWSTKKSARAKVLAEGKKFEVGRILENLLEWIKENFATDPDFIVEVKRFIKEERYERYCYSCGCLSTAFCLFVVMASSVRTAAQETN